MRLLRAVLVPALILANTLAASDAPAWRVWGGPNRDFKSPSTGLADSWPAGGPPRLWSRALGDGYSGIAAEDGVLYTAYQRGGQEVIVALSAQEGKTRWEHAHEAAFENAFSEVSPGPYAMPEVIGGAVLLAGATGKFFALDKKTGKVLWAHDLYQEFGGTFMKFGYSCHPLAYKDTVIMQVGGSGSAIVAFRQKDGTVAWKGGVFQNSHSSPLLINVDGQEQVIALTADNIIAFDPSNGAELWRHPHSTPYGLAVSTPVWFEGNILVVSSAYGTGTRAVHLTRNGNKTKVDDLWFNPKVYVHIGSLIADGSTLYVSSGQSGPAFLTAVDVKTGKVLWQNRGFAKAQLLWADHKLVVLDEDGALALVTATPQGMEVRSKVALLNRISWTMPTLAGTTLYVRDRVSLMALDLKKH